MKMRRFLAAIGDTATLVFALVVLWASFAPADPAAYAFPQLIALLLVIFCAVNFLRQTMRGFIGDPPIDGALLRKIAPGVGIIIIYVLFAAQLGFYLSAALAFAALSLCYGGASRGRQVLFVTAIFIGILYVMFSLALRVQVPREFFL